MVPEAPVLGVTETGREVPVPARAQDKEGSVVTTYVTHKVERRKGGMPRWAFFTPYGSHIDGKPFLTRFIFFSTPYGGCHITWSRQADNQREYPHDHSATFLSVRLLGGYEEDVFTEPADLSVREHRVHRWLSASRLRWTEAHSITRISRLGTVTLLILGRRRNHSVYWTPEGKQSIGLKMDQEWG
jgi:hypothetical protein